MRYLNLFWTFGCAIGGGMLCAEKTTAKNYFIQPVALENGFTIAGGFIETNGTIGPLVATDIIDYEVQLAGPLPVLFYPDAAGASVAIKGSVLASDVSISVPTVNAGGAWNAFDLHAEETFLSLCETCIQDLGWNNLWKLATWRYEFMGDPPVSPPNPPGFFELAAVRLQPPIDIVVASIPEPNTLFLGALACAWLISQHSQGGDSVSSSFAVRASR